MGGKLLQDGDVTDLVVIGGGLSGLTAAVLAARSGAKSCCWSVRGRLAAGPPRHSRTA